MSSRPAWDSWPGSNSRSSSKAPRLQGDGRHPTTQEYQEMMNYRRSEDMPKRLRTLVRGYCQQEGRRMLAEDHLADLRGALQRKDEE